MNRNRALALTASVAVAAVAAMVGYRVTRPDPVPRWAGPALATDRGTATEIGVEALRPRSADAVAAHLFALDGEADVTVTPGAILTLHAARPAEPGAVPDEATALAATGRVLRAYGMRPEEWTFRSLVTGQVRSVVGAVSGVLPAFAFKTVTAPQVTVRVDGKGVQAFTITPVRLHPHEVPVLSQREAFDRLTEPGRYVGVRLVLANPTTDALRPYWEFTSDHRDRRPVLAVLTP